MAGKRYNRDKSRQRGRLRGYTRASGRPGNRRRSSCRGRRRTLRWELYLPFFHPQKKDQQAPEVIADINFLSEVTIHKLCDAVLAEERAVLAHGEIDRALEQTAQRTTQPLMGGDVEAHFGALQNSGRKFVAHQFFEDDFLA